MLRVALRNVRAHLVRLGLSILAVVLGVSFVAGTFSLREMLSSTFDGIVDAGSSFDVYLRGGEDSAALTQENASAGAVRTTIPADLTDTVQGVDGVAHAFADYTGPLVLVGADGTPPPTTGAPTFGLAWRAADPSTPIAEGAAPSGPGEFLLEAGTAEASGLTVGDSTTLVVAGQVTEATLTGIVDMGASMAGASIVFFDEPTAAAAFAPDGMVSTISVLAEDGVGEQELADRITAAIGSAADAATGTSPVETVTGTTARDEAREDIASQLGFIETFLLVFAGISLFVGGFIIANTFAMTVRQRQRELALLRAVGASPLQVFASILVQAAVIGALGGALGVLGGLGLVTALKAVFGSMGMELAGDIPLDATTVVVSLVLGVVVSVASAALPARRAALVAPVEAMRDDSPAQAGSLRARGIAGAVVAGAGVGAVVVAVVQAAADETAGTGALLGLGAVGVIVGTLLLAPVVARGVLHVMSAPFVAWAKPLGTLARGNVTRNPRRTASTASALMIGMSLVGAASVLAVSMQASMKSIVADESLADLVVESATGTVPSGAVSDISALPEVGAADSLTADQYFVGSSSGDAADASPLFVLGVDPGVFGRTWQTETVEGSLDSLADGQVSVLQATAADEGWGLGDELTLRSQQGSVDVTIGSIFDSPALGVPVVVPDAVFAQLSVAPAEMSTMLLVKAADGVSQAELDAAVTAAAEPYMIVSVMDDEEYVSVLASQIDQMLTILYALLGLSIVIAVLGIVNTLALSVIERTREIGLLRAVGLGRSQLAGTIVIESVLTAVFGTLLGLAVGVGLAAAMPTVFASTGFTALAIPWAGLGTMVGIAVLVGVLAAGWPALRAARLPVLDAVSVD
ncbi:ABC transporter permease [Oerskovia enterophila]|uniref:Macrolide export ATP-binding/permease protein MacB n=1 Tax=Oerskovia enterophila TaxID=43678 RepID=A0A161XAE3_9CELL|nr:FtsX-like permease family protein [Oerskovia enterophila]KZM33517.1 macrolide export ATP-binding/permease protein MacB [Oerskovia enterophila]